MKHPENQFTIEEVEKLCQLYQECQLSMLEETELEYILMQSNIDSPLINDTKELMAVSRLCKPTAAKPQKNVGNWAFRAAACVAIVLSSFAVWHKLWLNPKNGDCIVYVAGEKVSYEEAHKIAEADVAKMQQFMQVVNEQQTQEETKVEQFMNHINKSR